MKAKSKMASVLIACMIGAYASGACFQTKPIVAEAWHWDFWNSYEDGCTVIYEVVSSYYSYKVLVVSSDGHTFWRNDDPAVPYWYSRSQLTTMLGTEPGNSGYKTVDIRSDLLADEDYFARHSG